jgi:UDPglucose 6-dehydrogenase
MFEIRLKNKKTFTSDSKITIFETAKSVRIFLDTVLTEWDEFKNYDWKTIYENMYNPAFVFDRRNILDAEMMKKLGFHFKGIGKG